MQLKAPIAVSGVSRVKGFGFHWELAADTFMWKWQEMVAQLDTPSIHQLLTSPNATDDRSCGLIRCNFEPRQGSYDLKRHHALQQQGLPAPEHKLPIWDFVLYREDGTWIRLHPSWSNKKVETFAPEAGPGFQKMQNGVLTFDVTKQPHGGPKGHGKLHGKGTAPRGK